MVGILWFYLDNCQYCKRADTILLELQNQNPAYGEVRMIKINEKERPDIAAKFTHSKVPAFFLGDRLLYEADAAETRTQMKENIEKVLRIAIEVQAAWDAQQK